MKAGDRVIVKAKSGIGHRWHVTVREVSADGRFAKVSSSSTRGQFGKPRWVAISELMKK